MYRMHNLNCVYLFVVPINVSIVSKPKSKRCKFSQLELPTLVMDINNYHPKLLSQPGECRRYSDFYMLGGKGFETRWRAIYCIYSKPV